MKLASHNTMSYLKPAKWWMRPFHFIAKCQSKTIVEQHALGVNMFDLRIAYDKFGVPTFAHGSMLFKGADVEETLGLINIWGNCYVRIIFEEPYHDIDTEYYSNIFKQDVEYWVDKYKNIKFFEGTRKYDWKKLVVNGLNKTPNYIQKISSMTGTILDDWWPRLYAMFNNKKNIEKYKDNNNDNWLFIDFIGSYY